LLTAFFICIFNSPKLFTLQFFTKLYSLLKQHPTIQKNFQKPR